jgi:hypothetical protein
MAGLICIAVALRNHEVGAFATIPVQGCECVQYSQRRQRSALTFPIRFVDMDRMNWDKVHTHLSR